MSNELVPVTADNLPANPFEDSNLEGLLGSDYFQRLQLMTSNTDLVKAGEFAPVNNFALIRDKSAVDVGKEVEAIPLAYRPKAVQTKSDPVITSYKRDSEVFIETKALSERDPQSGALFGLEYLLYLPDLDEYCTFFMSTKSMRRESPNIKSNMMNVIMISSYLAQNANYKWQTPKVKRVDREASVPSNYNEMISRFYDEATNHKEVELADNTEDNDER